MKTSWSSYIRGSSRARGFRALVQTHFEGRRRRNPKYSLRAFARDLGLDHATLSQIIRGRRGLTNAAITRIGERLGLSGEVIEHYLAPERNGARKPARAVEPLHHLSLDAFQVISDWHHFALLELLRVDGFRPDSRWIARALGITVDEVNIAISRLTRLGLLEMRDHGEWEDRSGNAAMAVEGLTDLALKRMQRESHELAIDAIERTPPALRDQASITVALSSRQLPRIMELVAKFRREIETLAGEEERRDDVYRIDISVFPLTTLNHDRENSHA